MRKLFAKKKYSGRENVEQNCQDMWVDDRKYFNKTFNLPVEKFESWVDAFMSIYE